MQATLANESNGGGVAAQLRDIERQGGGMASFAHWCAILLLVAGSLGSLISISGPAFRHFLEAAQAGRLDLPDFLNAVVGVLLVLAGDAALLYAASKLRVLIAAQATRGEIAGHAAVMIGVSLLEAGTYLYMAWLFDRPTTAVLWLIDIGRAVAWPLLCAYLSMARPLPVGPRDIMYHSALASGKGVVRDIAKVSADPDAPLHHKVRIYRAAANMTPMDRTKLDTLVSELTTTTDTPQSLALGRAVEVNSGPVGERSNVRTMEPPAPYKRFDGLVPAAYAVRRNDVQLVELRDKWDVLSAPFCADKPNIGGRQLLTYLRTQLPTDELPSRSRAQALAEKHRPAMLKLAAPRASAAMGGV